MNVSQAMIDRLKVSEGFRPRMYSDAAGLPTIGYGTLIDTAEEQYLMTATITPEQGEELLRKQLGTYERTVTDTIKVHLWPNQFDALVSLVYNIGPGAFRNGSLPGLINGHASAEAISRKWQEYRMAGGKVLQGLVVRRAEEVRNFWQHLWQFGAALLVVGAIALAVAAKTTVTA